MSKPSIRREDQLLSQLNHETLLQQRKRKREIYRVDKLDRNTRVKRKDYVRCQINSLVLDDTMFWDDYHENEHINEESGNSIEYTYTKSCTVEKRACWHRTWLINIINWRMKTQRWSIVKYSVLSTWSIKCYFVWWFIFIKELFTEMSEMIWTAT